MTYFTLNYSNACFYQSFVQVDMKKKKLPNRVLYLSGIFSNVLARSIYFAIDSIKEREKRHIITIIVSMCES